MWLYQWHISGILVVYWVRGISGAVTTASFEYTSNHDSDISGAVTNTRFEYASKNEYAMMNEAMMNEARLQ